MSSNGDGDRSHGHLGVSQSSKTTKKKAKRPIYPKYIPEQFSSGTHIDLRVSPSSSLVAAPDEEQDMHQLATRQRDQFGRVMIEPDGASWRPSKDAARALRESVRRLYTEPYHSWGEIPERIRQAMFNEFKTMCTWKSKYNMIIETIFERKASAKLSSWLKKAQNIKTPITWILPNVFEELCQYWDTDESKVLSKQVKKSRNNFRGSSLCTRGTKSVGTSLREMKRVLECTPLRDHEIFKRTRVKKKLNESDPDEWAEKMADHIQLMPEESTQRGKKKVVGGTHKQRIYGMESRNDVQRLQSGLEGIGSSSHQGEALDGHVYIAAMSQQIAQLTHAFVESEAKWVVQQESMKNNFDQIEQVLKLALQPTTEDIKSDEEDDT